MKKYLLLILVGFIYASCERTEDPEEKPIYDLFPLNVGNLFYYSYSYSYRHDPLVGPYKSANGKRQWRILTDSLKVNSIEYTFEEKYNGFEITTINYPEVVTDSINIIDSIRYFKIRYNSGYIRT